MFIYHGETNASPPIAKFDDVKFMISGGSGIDDLLDSLTSFTTPVWFVTYVVDM